MKKRVVVFSVAICLATVALLVSGYCIRLEKSGLRYADDFEKNNTRPTYNPLQVSCQAVIEQDETVHSLSAKDSALLGNAFVHGISCNFLLEIPSCGFDETKSLVVTIDKGTDAEANFIMASDGCPVFYHKETQTCFGLAHEHIEPFNEILTENGISFEIQKP
ncbi:MAG: hypothetical protein E7655_02800 [Ruminococcaceae bacterium]|nr:hypothetical protein [Oscillospiraceae bacterium]